MDSEVQDVRFMADHMLIKPGKYLRILGYDAAWDKQVRTQDLIARANAEERVFLTRNTHLADRYPRPRRAIVLKETGSVAQLNAVVKALNLDPRSRLFSRCVRCNVPLEAASDKEAVRARVVFHKFIDKCKRIYETLH